MYSAAPSLRSVYQENETSWISVRYLRIGAIAGLCGMALGIAMGASGNRSQMPLHAHVNLIGWVTMGLYALVYRAIPEAAERPLARWRFAAAVAGLLAILPGLAPIGMQHHDVGKRLAIVGSFLTLAGMLLFVAIVFRATRTAARRHAAPSRSSAPTATRQTT